MKDILVGNMEQAGLYCRGINGLWGVKQCVLSTNVLSKFSFYDHNGTVLVHFCFLFFAALKGLLITMAADEMHENVNRMA